MDLKMAFDPPHELLKTKYDKLGTCIGIETLKWIDAFLCFQQWWIVLSWW